MPENVSIRRNYAEINRHLDAISSHADSERDALGFLPEGAYAQYARQRKIFLLVTENDGREEYVGHIIFSGIFPSLKIIQTCVSPRFRKRGYATILLRALKSHAEKEGYLSIAAHVALDLSAANSFYERNGFKIAFVRDGGATRKRKINVRVLELDTPNLFSIQQKPRSNSLFKFATPINRTQEIPIYAIDLNVFFDLVKIRDRSEEAGVIFSAGLSHQIRIATASEFVAELEKRSANAGQDPILALAKRIPSLPKVDKATIDKLYPLISSIVFPERQAGDRLTENDVSDVRHLAHAIATGATGYITSDSKILAAHDRLLDELKLNVISLAELAVTLDLPNQDVMEFPKEAKHFAVQNLGPREGGEFLTREKINSSEFFRDNNSRNAQKTIGINDGRHIIGVGILSPAINREETSLLLIAVQQDHPYSSTIADYLITEHVRTCSRVSPCRILLLDLPTHPITRRIALAHGFQTNNIEPNTLVKFAMGYPLTKDKWASAQATIKRLSGLELDQKCPDYESRKVHVTTSAGGKAELSLFELETLLSPTLLILPKRRGVIVPITRQFAADLLDSDEQFSFLARPEAQFLSRRTYFNTVRAAKIMTPGSVMIFYESLRGKGQARAVAIARIVDTTTVSVSSIPENTQRAGVIENPEAITNSDKLLATTFDNLLTLKNPVSLKKLREIGCVGGSNLVSATAVNPSHLLAIVKAGFQDV